MNPTLTIPIIFSTLLMITGCSSAAIDAHQAAMTPDEPLMNTYWKLVRVDGAPVITQENFREAHMVLHQAASRLAGSTGCNTLMGSYQVESERITFNQVATTKMACPPHSMESELAFVGALKRITTWKIDGATLVLSGDQGKPRASFEAVHLY